MPSAVSSKDFKYHHPILTSRQKLNWSQGNLNSLLQDNAVTPLLVTCTVSPVQIQRARFMLRGRRCLSSSDLNIHRAIL